MADQLNAETRYLVIDLEATCWKGPAPAQNEIIEIGAVLYEPRVGPVAEYQAFVRPMPQPSLSDFCRELTNIRQEDIDSARPFPGVFRDFLDWAAGHEPYVFASWGDYDRKQLESDCALHGVAYPFRGHVNLKTEFARLVGGRPCGMQKALSKIGLPLEGTHHRAIDDVRNIARILDYLNAR